MTIFINHCIKKDYLERRAGILFKYKQINAYNIHARILLIAAFR